MLRWLALFVAVLGTAPVRVSIRLDVNEKPTFSFLVFVYSIPLRFTGLIGPKGKVLMQRSGSEDEVDIPIRALWQFTRQFIRGVEPLSLTADCRIGTGDACSTALCASALYALLLAASDRIGARIRVTPVFGKAVLTLQMRCILFFRIGDIILAGAMAFMHRRLRKRKEGNADGTASH